MAAGNSNNNNDFVSWVVVVIALMAFWPVGVLLLIRKLTAAGSGQRRAAPRSGGRDTARTAPGSQGTPDPWESAKTVQVGDVTVKKTTGAKKAPAAKAAAQTVPRRGLGLVIAGAIVAGAFGIGILSMLGEFMAWGYWSDLEGLFPCLGFLGAGLTMLGVGLSRRRAAKRMRRYLPLIGRQNEVKIDAIAQAMKRPASKVAGDLQEMLDLGVLPTGYLDLNRGVLVLGDEGVTAPEPEPEEIVVPDLSEENRILQEIREVNDAIADEEMSRKIDRIGEISSKIFQYQKQNPGKETQLRGFLSYYLPTTLKILRAYAQMEAQGVEGENIRAAKERIEGMMDKVVEGFEKQLDLLFQNDAMDVSSDVAVLERMLEKDGLSGGTGMTL